MRRYQLRTLGGISLNGPAGPVPLDEPHLVALLVMLALSGEGVPESDLLLRLFPGETPQRARGELARLLAVLRLRLGGESAIVAAGQGLALAPGLVGVDVRARGEPAATRRDDFLQDFRLPSSPEFRDWLEDTRRRVEPVQSTGPGASRARYWAAAVAIAVLIVGVSAAALVSRSRANDAVIGEQVVVADVVDETGDSLSAALLRAATVGLEQSRRVALFPRSRLADVYQRMEIANPDTSLTMALAQEVAEREGVRFALGLHVRRERDGYRMTADLVDVARGKHRTSSAIAADASTLIAALDEVLRDVRRQLGESRAELAERGEALPEVTTASLEALRSYAAGAEAWNRGNFALARDFLLRAVDLDTGFAAAMGFLGRYYYHHHNREEGQRYYTAAMERGNRLTERERLRLTGGWAADRGDYDSAIVVYRQLAERYPNYYTWENYGNLLMRAQRNQEAVSVFRRAVSFDSTSYASTGAWVNLATVLSRIERHHEAIDAYHRAASVDSTVLYRNNLNHEYGAILVRVGRVADAESVYARMAAAGPSLVARAAGERSLGLLALWRGHLDEATRRLERASALTVEARQPMSEARNRMLLAWAYRLAGHRDAANAELDRVFALRAERNFEPMFLGFIVTALVRQGRVDDAEAVLRILRARVDSVNAGDVAAEAVAAATIAQARGRSREALALVRRAGSYRQPIRKLALEAEIRAASGETDSATALFNEVLGSEAYGAEAQEDWLRVPMMLGDLRLAAGDTAGAREAWGVLLRQWSSAPASTPELAAARARLIAVAGTADR
jgi:tetratricopeptide (TPR) repeat protein